MQTLKNGRNRGRMSDEFAAEEVLRASGMLTPSFPRDHGGLWVRQLHIHPAGSYPLLDTERGQFKRASRRTVSSTAELLRCHSRRRGQRSVLWQSCRGTVECCQKNVEIGGTLGVHNQVVSSICKEFSVRRGKRKLSFPRTGQRARVAKATERSACLVFTPCITGFSE